MASEPIAARTASAQVPAPEGLALLSSTQTALALQWQPAEAVEGVLYEAELRVWQGPNGQCGEWGVHLQGEEFVLTVASSPWLDACLKCKVLCSPYWTLRLQAAGLCAQGCMQHRPGVTYYT